MIFIERYLKVTRHDLVKEEKAMPGLKLFTGNRLEALVEQLAETLREQPASPLDPEIVVVQSKGMERWVSMELARLHGICANFRFPFPNAVVDEVFRHVLGDLIEELHLPDFSPFDPAVMTWKLMGLLPDGVMRPGFEALRSYIEADTGQLKRFQLSRRIAQLFDQYLLYRPDMIFAWESGTSGEMGKAGGAEDMGAASWQAQLWRDLARGAESMHRAALRKACLARLRAIVEPPPALPGRLAIFGISSLPPFHMEVFRELGRFIPVNLFLMNPCREYWGEIRSEREMSRITRRRAGEDLSAGAVRPDLTAEELYFEEGNSLLASMGKIGRDFLQLTQEMVEESAELFDDPGEETLLACIQRDVLNLAERDPENKTIIDPADRSIVIHSCHSPMREIEVLYDQLLALFEEEPGVVPRDVLVMTPDINVYAPFIHAVFDAPEQPALRIPFTITDRSLRKESRIIEAFLAILELVDSRLGAPQVLALLEAEALRRRFGLAETDVLLIHRWVNDTRIRWGTDAQSRTALGFGDFAENSWRTGLDRLLLGYALPGGDERMFLGVLPFDHIEGSDAVVLGRFLDFIHRLFATIEALAHPRPLNVWAETLIRLLDGFFAPDPDGEKEALSLRQVLNDLADKQQSSGFTDPVTLEVIRSFLGERLEAETVGLGFITGGVTFCAMLPMRSIPFEVICLVGMNDGAFPRRSRMLGFDLMARSPRPGDRSQRNDDRYLFLEALLSARRRLYVSYVGQSQEDNSPLPPSVLVSELLDVIGKGYEVSGKEDILDHLTTRHRLQPFSPFYFKGDNSKYFSYSAENCRAGRDAGGMRAEHRPFIVSNIGEPEPEWTGIDVNQLAAFFTHPGKFLVKKRLQVQLETSETAAEDREIFELDSLERYLLEEQLLERKIAGQDDLSNLFAVMKASGRLPHGAVGACRYGLLTGSVETFYATVAPFVQAPMLPPLAVDLSLPPFQLTGRIDGITERGLVHFRSAAIKAKDHLNLWIRHLVLNALSAAEPSDIQSSATASYPRTGFLIGKDDALQYAPVDEAARIIETLLGIYWEGLQRQIHFFPRSSHAYARKRVDGGTREEALKAARSEWEPPGFQSSRPGEGEDPYLRLCFARSDPLDEEFERLAMEVFQPLLEHEQPVKRL